MKKILATAALVFWPMGFVRRPTPEVLRKWREKSAAVVLWPVGFVWRMLPKVLHHAEIRRWRQEQSLELTRKFRPDLLSGGRS